METWATFDKFVDVAGFIVKYRHDRPPELKRMLTACALADDDDESMSNVTLNTTVDAGTTTPGMIDSETGQFFCLLFLYLKKIIIFAATAKKKKKDQEKRRLSEETVTSGKENEDKGLLEVI